LDTPDSRPDLSALVQELEAAREEFWDAADNMTGNWRLEYGPIRLSRSFNSQRITQFFLTFCALCIAGGGVLALIDSTKELGIALVVGGIFAFGTSVVQVWAVQVQREFDLMESIGLRGRPMSEENVRLLRELSRRIDLLSAEVEARDPGYLKRRLQGDS
jgi:hypothetical protein